MKNTVSGNHGSEVSRKTPNISAKWKDYHEFFSLLELKKLLANFFFFKQFIEIAEIRRLVLVLLSPQISIVKSLKKKKNRQTQTNWLADISG